MYKAFDREGISYEKTAVGDKYVYENMAATGNCLGGEQSGHIIFSKHATTGDGILTSLKVMEVILEKKQTLAKLASEYEVYPQVLKNVKVKDKKAAQDDEKVQMCIRDRRSVDQCLCYQKRGKIDFHKAVDIFIQYICFFSKDMRMFFISVK